MISVLTVPCCSIRIKIRVQSNCFTQQRNHDKFQDPSFRLQRIVQWNIPNVPEQLQVTDAILTTNRYHSVPPQLLGTSEPTT